MNSLLKCILNESNTSSDHRSLHNVDFLYIINPAKISIQKNRLAATIGAATDEGISSDNDIAVDDNDTILPKPRVAFITAVFGNYEASCKPYSYQTIPADFICFSDNASIVSNQWTVDITPYHLLFWMEQLDKNFSYFDEVNISSDHIIGLKNYIAKNDHNFNIAKFYKTSFDAIPRLEGYDVVIWVDGTVELHSPEIAEHVLEHFNSRQSSYTFMAFEMNFRGNLSNEALSTSQYELWSNSNTKYVDAMWGNHKQPPQLVDKQYETYLEQRYNNDYFAPNGVYEKAREGMFPRSQIERPHIGVWFSCFIAFNLRGGGKGRVGDGRVGDGGGGDGGGDVGISKMRQQFLRHRTYHVLRYSTNDQLSFSFLIQKLNLTIYSLPDEDFVAGSFYANEWFDKLKHGI